MKKTEKKMIKTTVLSVSVPIELISNILSKLPMKDIIRFKTVSKAWNTLISSLPFISPTNTSFLNLNLNRPIFKIVCVAPNKLEDGWTVGNEVWVYSLKSDSWKIIDHHLSGGVCIPCITGVLINNHLLHWVFFGVDDNEYCIIRSFDVCSEQWSQVPLPASNFERFLIKLVGFDGRLYLKTICDESSMFVMDVYGVKDSWVKLFDCFDEVFNDTHFVYPLSYSESRSEVFVEVQFESRFYWCNLTEKTRREVKFHNVQPRGAGVECIRSLAHLPGCG